MTIKITVPEDHDAPELKPRISVIGVGGAGGNAINNMIAANLEGCDFIVANTDAQAIKGSKADRRIQLGTGVTKGLGAGSKPEVGKAAAEESISEILDELHQSNMVFIAAGMGGGTGTGAAPVIAKAAREHGILTVGVVTKPFQFEGSHRMRLAEQGLDELAGYVDTLIIIPNQNLFRVANEKTTFADAFKMADDVLYSGVRSITDLMVMPGLINLDFADVESVMQGMGRAMMGTGEAAGERRALDAAEAAISNPLLDDASMRGARGVLINITGGEDITLFEVDEAANRVRAEVDEDAYIIIGSAFDQSMEGSMRVSVVATGLEAAEGEQPSHLHILNQAQRIAPVRVPRPEEEPKAATPSIVTMRDEPVPAPEPAPEITDDVAESAADSFDSEAMDAVAEDDADPIAALDSAPEAAEAAPAELQPRVPAAMPGAGNVESFIPQRAVEVEDDDAMDGPATGADPFEVAAMVNGSNADDETSRMGGLLRRPKKEGGGLSLFERVTGTGRAKKPEETAVSEPAPAVQPAATSERGTIDALIRSRTATPQMAENPAPAPVQAPTPVQAAPVQAAPAKAPLGGVDPADRLPSADTEDDLLDIPAFLRRQAN
ncbi:MAG: cell division protein FtsZ [Alphaproteobacteria bacterium]